MLRRLSPLRPLRVLLVDPQEIVRRGLRTVFGERRDLTVVGEASTAREALESVLKLEPDLVVTELLLPDGSGAAVCREIRRRQPEVQVVVFTHSDDNDGLYSAVAAGAAGYATKDIDPVLFRDSLVSMGSGGALLDPQTAVRMLNRVRSGHHGHPADDAFTVLSPQEDRILEMMADGLTNRAVAARLSLTEKTVKNYVTSVYAKLHVHHRAEAVALATTRRGRKDEFAYPDREAVR